MLAVGGLPPTSSGSLSSSTWHVLFAELDHHSARAQVVVVDDVLPEDTLAGIRLESVDIDAQDEQRRGPSLVLLAPARRRGLHFHKTFPKSDDSVIRLDYGPVCGARRASLLQSGYIP
ncbi:hypothetical protein MAPG_11399 [Magnaporthiopsis poae ATCC 64411]|uniref:Uncharacterized protein n=1 Tax=Magnaporthiopsis poae (strain ATCC 64411 / 73-15) TaxID=644358 RepID=A0A0C4EF65_MAGP6|nr:hypothetical protein MAPG_11399 [Magnaporthiopsis poae ATCC 64411]